jgi:hypothetical protein
MAQEMLVDLEKQHVILSPHTHPDVLMHVRRISIVSPADGVDGPPAAFERVKCMCMHAGMHACA